jgi:hypothetical protein
MRGIFSLLTFGGTGEGASPIYTTPLELSGPLAFCRQQPSWFIVKEGVKQMHQAWPD